MRLKKGVKIMSTTNINIRVDFDLKWNTGLVAVSTE